MVKFCIVHCNDTIPKIQNKYSQKRNCAAAVSIPTFIFLWAIFFPLIGLSILLQENRCAKPGIYRSLTDTWMWKLALRPRNSFSGNKKLKFLWISRTPFGFLSAERSREDVQDIFIRFQCTAGRLCDLLALECFIWQLCPLPLPPPSPSPLCAPHICSVKHRYCSYVQYTM